MNDNLVVGPEALTKGLEREFYKQVVALTPARFCRMANLSVFANLTVPTNFKRVPPHGSTSVERSKSLAAIH